MLSHLKKNYFHLSCHLPLFQLWWYRPPWHPRVYIPFHPYTTAGQFALTTADKRIDFFHNALAGAYHLMKWPTAGVYLHSLGCKTPPRGSRTPIRSPDSNGVEAKFGSADPKSYADRLFCQKLPLNPDVRLSPLSAPVDGPHKIPASFLPNFLWEKLKLASECFRRSEMRWWSEDWWEIDLCHRGYELATIDQTERCTGGMIKQIWSADASVVLGWSWVHRQIANSEVLAADEDGGKSQTANGVDRHQLPCWICSAGDKEEVKPRGLGLLNFSQTPEYLNI